MQITEMSDYNKMSEAAAEIMINRVKEKPDACFCLATGDSPALAYKLFVKRVLEEGVDVSRLRVVKLDEWRGLPKSSAATCEYYLREQILTPLGVAEERYISFDPEAEDAETECERVSALIEECGGISLCVTGLGKNGHLGLNEPYGGPFARVSVLSAKTKGHSMLAAAENAEVSEGFTLSVKDILASKEILLLAAGKGKTQAYKNLKKKTLSPQYPANYLWLHKNAVCLADMSSLSGIINYDENIYFNAELLPAEAFYKQERNLEYLLGLDVENLLFHFRFEAGTVGSRNFNDKRLHGGWDSPTSHIRGTFTGHYLSAAALLCKNGKNGMLRAKADYIVDEIRKCQTANGGQWAFPIPEKYIYQVKKGGWFWAPFYVCHKVMMGLLDMYRLLGSETAFAILTDCAKWFTAFMEQVSSAELEKMMDFQETGGMMEFWADFYALTGEEEHLGLMRRFERVKLFDALLEGKDVLTNMHANTTIPEIHGAARAYEVTGEERYLNAVKNYWDLTVTKRGMYATGGQTSGEVWTPLMRQSARLGDQNQEHCVVYNMIRLADYLFKFTKEAQYGDYIERNIVNGVFAQGFYTPRMLETRGESVYAETGIVSYYLPLTAGSHKVFSGKTEDFWCCHCTVVQANARLWEYIYYLEKDRLIISQYLPSTLKTELNGASVEISLTAEDPKEDCLGVDISASGAQEKPKRDTYTIKLKTSKQADFAVSLRVPWWITGKALCYIDGKEQDTEAENGYFTLRRRWDENQIKVVFPRGLHTWSLADAPDTVAFLDGPAVLAGIVAEERTLRGDKNAPESMLAPSNERVWGNWTKQYKTINQPNGFYFKPLNEIGEETYTVYFPVEKC
ncbi:MAG: glycoside hydrolase family 127 protein [Clostridiales bacterium]|jgi:DUF1680 family protein/6-phosphogluconolactonase/glucosamine-6-phosphate isomerase/deaminase|nr:glycoside hydrolase family 127 protein [Clostridiales bacterium]